MDSTLESEINAMITQRILAYHQNLIDGGQIREFAVNLPAFDCSQLERRHLDGRSKGLAPQQDAHSQPAASGSGCE
jgi:hypothetical protein